MDTSIFDESTEATQNMSQAGELYGLLDWLTDDEIAKLATILDQMKVSMHSDDGPRNLADVRTDIIWYEDYGQSIGQLAE